MECGELVDRPLSPILGDPLKEGMGRVYELVGTIPTPDGCWDWGGGGPWNSPKLSSSSCRC